jgi:hypothetical protein
LRDLLLQLATANLFRAQWSEEIQEEWINALLREGRHTREQLERTKDLMNAALLDANVTDYASYIEAVTLPDPNDRHVVRARVLRSYARHSCPSAGLRLGSGEQILCPL